METLPIFLDKLINPVGAILCSVTLVLLFGEIIPQAICQRFGLAIGHYTRHIVWFVLYLTFPLNYPIAKVLDYLLGADHHHLLHRHQLKALVSIHGKAGGMGGDLSSDETSIIAGALDMTGKTVGTICFTALHEIKSIPCDTVLSWKVVNDISKFGHSRVPVYQHDNPADITGVIMLKDLFASMSSTAATAASLAGVVGVNVSPSPPRLLTAAVPPRRIPAFNVNTPLYTALNYFQTGHSHMALVTTGDSVLYLDDRHKKFVAENRLKRQNSLNNKGSSSSPAADAENKKAKLQAKLHRRNSTGAPSGDLLAPPIIVKDLADEGTTSAGGASLSGRIIGIITLEDILEEMLQEEILDESDRAASYEAGSSLDTKARHENDAAFDFILNDSSEHGHHHSKMSKQRTQALQEDKEFV